LYSVIKGFLAIQLQEDPPETLKNQLGKKRIQFDERHLGLILLYDAE